MLVAPPGPMFTQAHLSAFSLPLKSDHAVSPCIPAPGSVASSAISWPSTLVTPSRVPWGAGLTKSSPQPAPELSTYGMLTNENCGVPAGMAKPSLLTSCQAQYWLLLNPASLAFAGCATTMFE